MMKFIKYGWLAALPMIFTACQEDVLVKEQQQDKIYTLSATMDRGSAMSRAQIQLGNQDAESGETFIWNENDSFDFYQRVNDEWVKSTFTIQNYSEQNPAASATFSTTSGVEAGVVFKAYYPANDLNNGVNHILPDGIELSANPAQDWKDYFSTYMFMEASADYLDAENPVVSFRHICSLARITYTNQTGADQAITYFALNGNQEGTFGTGESGGRPADRCGLEVSGLTVADGESVDLYLLFFPKEFKENGKLQVIMKHPSADESVNQVSTSDISVSLISQANNDASGFEAGKRYWFQVTETTDGLVWTKDVNQGEEDDQTTVTFTNKEFAKALEAVLEKGKIRFDKDSCGVMYESDVLAVTSLNFYDYEGKANITSLEGLKHFVSLEDFCCGGASVTGALKVSNKNLRRLDVSDNKLTSLDVSGLSDLDYLNCSINASLGNNITITGTALTDLQFHHTGATSLAFIPDAFKSQIVNFDCGNNKVTSMDLSAYTSVEYIHISGNGVTELVLPETETLKVLDMSHNTSITSVDLTQYPNLVEFYNQQNNLKSIDVTNCPNLSILFTNSNQMTKLDLTNNPKLEHLLCGEQQDGRTLMLKLHSDLLLKWKNEWAKENTQNVYLDETVLDVVTIKNAELTAALVAVLGADTVKIDPDYGYGLIDGNIALEIKELNFNEGYIPSLNNGIEFFKNLTKLECRYVDLQTCDLSKNTKLTYVDVQSNQLTSLNLAGCENLEQLFCQSNNNLKTLDLTGCTKLWNFQAHGTALTSLNIPNPSAMDNMLLPAGVGIDNWTNWDTFATTFSNLTGLGLQNKQNVVLKDIPEDLRLRLTYLNVNQTRIEALDLSLFPSLTALDCEWNSIKTLDLKKVPNLQTLHCMGNRIAELDITGLSGLTDLKCGRQGAEDNVLQLTLKLTTEQMTQWAAEWKDNGCNIGVTAEEVTNAGGSSNS